MYTRASMSHTHTHTTEKKSLAEKDILRGAEGAFKAHVKC